MANEILQGDEYVVDTEGGPYVEIPYLSSPVHPVSDHLSYGDIPLSTPDMAIVSISEIQPSSWTTILDLDQDDAPYGGVIPYGMWVGYEGATNPLDIRYLELTIDDQPTKVIDLASVPVLASGGSSVSTHQQHLKLGLKWSKNITIRANRSSGTGAQPVVTFGYHLLSKDD